MSFVKWQLMTHGSQPRKENKLRERLNCLPYVKISTRAVASTCTRYFFVYLELTLSVYQVMKSRVHESTEQNSTL